MTFKKLCATSLILLSLASGCGEATRIRTSPSDARVYVDGRLIGISPAVYRCSRSEFRNPHTCRAELDGYAPVEEPLRKTLCVGRLMGAIFTLGIVYAFRSPYCFRKTHELILTKLPAAAPESGVAPAAPSGPSVESRLQRIKQLRQQGRLTQEEYDRYEVEILREGH